jgi:hypothetical protein
LLQWGQYQLSWVEVLLVGAAMMSMAEQLRVSHPGIDNTIEAILMAAIAAVQVLLFALGAAGVRPLRIFNNTEFLMLTLISMTQAVVAILINARTCDGRSASATAANGAEEREASPARAHGQAGKAAMMLQLHSP